MPDLASDLDESHRMDSERELLCFFKISLSNYYFLIKAGLSDVNQMAHIHTGVSEAPEQPDYNQGEAVELSKCARVKFLLQRQLI